MVLLTLLRHADVYAPESLGVTDIWIAGSRIVHLGEAQASAALIRQTIDIKGQRVIPGLIDGHVHVTGGGGESGPGSRVPPVTARMLSDAGITTCVGLLGTDGTTRSIASLVARTLGLRAEGLSAYCYTGSYEVPVRTLTGSVRSDITFIDPIIGVGELAISDHRSSQPTYDELVRIAADAHVGGLMSGKAGILHLHLGDGARGLALVRQALAESELPPRVFHPTHVNRNKRLFEEALALAPRGCTIDVTAFAAGDDGLSAEDAIGAYLDAKLPRENLTCSSDGCGCLPTFNAQGEMTAMDVGKPAALSDALRALLAKGRALVDVLPIFTSNPAHLLRLARKGRIAVGYDADLAVLDPSGQVSDTMALGRFLKGQWMSRGAQ